MAYQIEKTFIGTSDPLSLTSSLSYYGAHAPDSSDLSIHRNTDILNVYQDNHIGLSAKFNINVDLTAGLVLPSWTAKIPVESGEIDSTSMTVTIGDDEIMGGMLLGAKFVITLTYSIRRWHDGYFSHWKWHSGHWGDYETFSMPIPIDLIPACVDTMVALLGLIPKLKILIQVIPKGWLDHMEDKKAGISSSSGVFIDASLPLRYDLISIGRVIAESGLEVASLGLTPAGAAVVTLLVELAEFFVSLLDKLKVVQVAVGPQVDVTFPVRVKITKLYAADADERVVNVFDNLSFDGKTITGYNDTQKELIPARIGMHFNHTLEIPETDLGVWGHISLFWIFGVTPFWDLHVMDIIDKEFDIDPLGVHFDSSMSNVIGGTGWDDSKQAPPDTITVKFI